MRPRCSINRPVPAISTTKVRINEQIRVPTVRVVDPQGKHGIYPIEEALRMAREQELDLVEISPAAEPPVCKIIDFGKYKYELQKREKEARKNSHQVEMKEIRFRPHTDTHDFDFKVKHAKAFLSDGHKVRAYVQFRGRDIVYKDHGMDVLTRFMAELGELAKMDQEPRMEGRRMALILSPSKKKA